MVSNKKIESYIELCIKQACEVEKRQNDVQYWYKVINDELLFYIKTKYHRVYRRVIYRLLQNSLRNLGLTFTLVHPNPIREGYEFYHGRKYDIIELSTSIDPNYSIDLWEIGKKTYTIRCVYGNHPGDTAVEHLEQLKANGYDYLKDQHDWSKFMEAYQKIYHMTPFEFSQILWNEHHKNSQDDSKEN